MTQPYTTTVVLNAQAQPLNSQYSTAPPQYANYQQQPPPSGSYYGQQPGVAYYGQQQPPPNMYGQQQPPNASHYGQQPAQLHPVTVAEPRDVEGMTGNSFSEKKIRQAFIKKVYLILMLQLTVTVGFICLFIFCKPVKKWVQENMVAYYVSYAIFLVVYIVLICIPGVRRRTPLNFICLAIFTLALSYMTGTISSFYNTTIVLYAMGITAAVCLAISIFAIQTKIDFTMCAGLIFALCMVVIMFGFSCLITYLIVGNTFGTHVMYCVYGGLVALLFSLFLVFDTQRVVGGKNRKFVLSPEEYITGALELYLDIVNLFLIILGLFGGNN